MDVDADATPAWVDYGVDQVVVEKWVRRTWGDKVFESIEERTLRIVEEALELSQAEAHDKKEIREKLHLLVDRVFDKKPGEPYQELGGLIVTTLAYCAAKEVRLDKAAQTEIDRVHGFDREHFLKRQQEKIDAGVTARPE